VNLQLLSRFEYGAIKHLWPRPTIHGIWPSFRLFLICRWWWMVQNWY